MGLYRLVQALALAALIAVAAPASAAAPTATLTSADKPIKWSKGWAVVPGPEGEVRYDAVVQVPTSEGLGVSIGRVAAQWDLSAGGASLGKGDGSPPAYAWFELPAAAVAADGTVALSLTTTRPGGDGGISRLQGGPFRIGRHSVIQERTRRLLAQNSSKRLPILLLLGALLALGLYHLMLVGTRKEFDVYLKVGLMALAFAAHAALVQGWGRFLPLDIGYRGRAQLEPALALAASHLVLAVLHKLLDIDPGRIGNALLITLLVGAGLCLIPGVGLALSASPLQTVLGLAAVYWALTLFARGSWTHPNGPPILVGVGVLVGASVYDATAGSKLPVAYLGLLGFVLSIAVALGRHFRRTLVELDLRNAQLQRFNDAANRFVPAELLNLIGRDSVVDVERGDQKQLELTVMFSDVRGFTTLAEARTPAQTMDLINRYLRFMEDHVHDYDGAIGAFLGDGVMALYYGGADRAVQSAIAQLDALKDFNVEQEARGDTALKIGIGFNTGKLMLGTVGGHDRLDCSVIGDAVNLAARIEGLTKRYGATILLSQTTYDRLEDRTVFRLRAVDSVVVKGKTEPMTLYELIDGLPAEVAEQRAAQLERWEEARGLYLEKRFADARSIFTELAVQGDVAAKLYDERCMQLDKLGVTPDWDGTFEWTVK